MRIVFCGTPEFAVPTLAALARAGHEIATVITQPDRPKGRGLKLTPPPVKVAAEKLGVHVLQPEGLKGSQGRQLLEQWAPEVVVIVGYGQIIPADLLGLPQHGWVNLHASLLPKYRGAAPVNWAIIRGETQTGVTTMRIDAGLDTGPIFLQREEPIRPNDTAVTLGERLAKIGAGLMIETLRGIATGTLVPQLQDHAQATKAPLLKKEDGRIDWHWEAADIQNRIRGLVPWPGAYTSFRGQFVHIWRAEPRVEPLLRGQAPPGTLVVESGEPYVVCGPVANEWLRLEEVQVAGRKRVCGRDFVNGLHLKTGERFEGPG